MHPASLSAQHPYPLGHSCMSFMIWHCMYLPVSLIYTFHPLQVGIFLGCCKCFGAVILFTPGVTSKGSWNSVIRSQRAIMHSSNSHTAPPVLCKTHKSAAFIQCLSVCRTSQVPNSCRPVKRHQSSSTASASVTSQMHQYSKTCRSKWKEGKP